MNDHPLGTTLELANRVDSIERLRWAKFYADRKRPCPFFGSDPDDNLVEWVNAGRIVAGAALDIGCGNGRNSIYLASKHFSVQGIDLSEQAIAWARERAGANQRTIDFVCGSIFDNVPKPHSLDFVYDSGCFHHLPPHHRRNYAELVASALKPGAFFGLTCFAPEGGSGYTDEQVYENGTIGGGLGYSDNWLHDFWGQHLEVAEINRMNETSADSGRFGKSFLWVMLARAR